MLDFRLSPRPLLEARGKSKVPSRGWAILSISVSSLVALCLAGCNRGHVELPSAKTSPPPSATLAESLVSPPTTAPPVVLETQGGSSTGGECNDGVDNDGDGWVDWQFDLGCSSAGDDTERAAGREEEDGWTTFDKSEDSKIVYVSASTGSDTADGLSPETAVKTIAHGASLVRNAHPDFLLLRRGDTWKGEALSSRGASIFKSGRDPAHRLVVGSYGPSKERPRLLLDRHFIDDAAKNKSNLAFVGLALISYPKIPGDPAFDGHGGGAFRFVGTGSAILLEDNYIEYGEIITQNVSNVEIRRNVVYRSYHEGTCAYKDGVRVARGNRKYRPSGIYAGKVKGLLVEDNVWDENGWNPDVKEACATIFNHNLYLSNAQDVVVRNNVVLRSSSIGIKLASGGERESFNIRIEDNLIAEGEVGISMGGNARTAHRFQNAVIANNVLTDIGRSEPTGRSISWYIELVDNDGTLVEGNLMLHQPDLSTTQGVALAGASNRNVTIAKNHFSGLGPSQIRLMTKPGWGKIQINDNRFSNARAAPCIIRQQGGFHSVTYARNDYQGATSADDWFCIERERLGLGGWRSRSKEPVAPSTDAPSTQPARNVESYAMTLGLGATLADFARAARGQSRLSYKPALEATSVNAHIRSLYRLNAASP